MDSDSNASDFSRFDDGDFSDAFSSMLADAASDESLDFAMPEHEGILTDAIASESAVAQPDRKATGRAPKTGLTIARQRMSGLLPRRTEKIRGEDETSAATRPASRETTHVWTGVILVGGLIASFTLYLAFTELSPVSLDPLGNSLIYFGLSMAALTVCAVALAFAIRGALVGHPKHRPATAIVIAVLVVPFLVLGAGALGLNEAKREVQDSAVSSAGRTFVWVLDLMVEEGVNIGPLARLLE